MNPLPCPFCGSDDVAVFSHSAFRWVYATCKRCGAQAGEVRVDTISQWRSEAQVEAERRAIEEWNTRSPSAEKTGTGDAGTLTTTTEGESNHDRD